MAKDSWCCNEPSGSCELRQCLVLFWYTNFDSLTVVVTTNISVKHRQSRDMLPKAKKLVLLPPGEQVYSVVHRKLKIETSSDYGLLYYATWSRCFLSSSPTFEAIWYALLSCMEIASATAIQLGTIKHLQSQRHSGSHIRSAVV